MNSLNYLGGAGNHSDQYRHFNHAPEIKPWAKSGGKASAGASAIVKLYMGESFPVRSCAADIIQRIETFAALGPEQGLAAYLLDIGPRGRVMLAAIKRNFTRHPERWAALGGD